jgi:hypothetical protein
MVARVRIAIVTVLAATLITSITALAKGGFDIITITGPKLKEAVRLTDTDLTADFFTFANFFEDKTKAPVDPGQGYEITRHYVQGQSDIIFDRLHYYPETGYVFYDGIEKGDSEYDGEWYIADPEIKTVFESALAAPSEAAAPVEKNQPVLSESQSQPGEATVQAKPARTKVPTPLILVILLTAGLAALLAAGRRKPSTQS